MPQFTATLAFAADTPEAAEATIGYLRDGLTDSDAYPTLPDGWNFTLGEAPNIPDHVEILNRAADDVIASVYGSEDDGDQIPVPDRDLINILVNVAGAYFDGTATNVREAISVSWDAADERLDPDAARRADEDLEVTVDTVLSWPHE